VVSDVGSDGVAAGGGAPASELVSCELADSGSSTLPVAVDNRWTCTKTHAYVINAC
jgi:hypothetical protein